MHSYDQAPNVANPEGWQGNFPVVVLRTQSGQALRFEPQTQFLPKSAMAGWALVTIPLTGDGTWRRTGTASDAMSSIEIHVDTLGYGPFDLWVTGIQVSGS